MAGEVGVKRYSITPGITPGSVNVLLKFSSIENENYVYRVWEQWHFTGTFQQSLSGRLGSRWTAGVQVLVSLYAASISYL